MMVDGDFQYEGVAIDMMFAQLPYARIDSKKFNILDDEILRGVEGAMVLSLNGPRATELIRLLVPENKCVYRQRCTRVVCVYGPPVTLTLRWVLAVVCVVRQCFES